ncbi:MAG TPA: ATP-binding protein, partial [Terricaulis sp.]|nr:ATP-binding protein [Terricaulis sp.]
MADKSIGAVWQRWDPHIHAPGTLFSDKFKGPNAWDEYLTAIETSEPRVRALGVTDYYGLELYEEVVAHKKAGRLRDVDLIFPNVELRLAVGLPKGSAINIHLLISPEDRDHVDRAKEFLQGLTFDGCRCDRAGLIRLGNEQQSGLSDAQALEEGAKQFKVSLDELESTWFGSDWAKQHIL